MSDSEEGERQGVWLFGGSMEREGASAWLTDKDLSLSAIWAPNAAFFLGIPLMARCKLPCARLSS